MMDKVCYKPSSKHYSVELLHIRILYVVKRVEFINDRMSYIVLKGRWFNIIFLNMHAPVEEKRDDSKDSFMSI